MSIEAFQYVTMVQAAKPSCGTGSAFESLPCHFNFFDKECESNMTQPVRSPIKSRSATYDTGPKMAPSRSQHLFFAWAKSGLLP